MQFLFINSIMLKRNNAQSDIGDNMVTMEELEAKLELKEQKLQSRSMFVDGQKQLLSDLFDVLNAASEEIEERDDRLIRKFDTLGKYRDKLETMKDDLGRIGRFAELKTKPGTTPFCKGNQCSCDDDDDLDWFIDDDNF
jgi:predicted  nucleic acid-binding Zn-ribbon protein